MSDFKEHADAVHFGALKREMRRAIEQYYFARQWEDVEHSWITLESAAVMFFRLRAADDTPELFPHGKWATVQALEDQIEQAFTLGRIPK